MKIETTQQANKIMELAIGRIFRLGSRPFQVGDVQLYEEAKWAVMDAAEFLGMQTSFQDTICYAADYKKIHHD